MGLGYACAVLSVFLPEPRAPYCRRVCLRLSCQSSECPDTCAGRSPGRSVSRRPLLGPACSLRAPTEKEHTGHPAPGSHPPPASRLPPASRQSLQALLSSCWAHSAWTCGAGAVGSSCVSLGTPRAHSGPGTAGARPGPLGRGGACTPTPSSLQLGWLQRCTRAPQPRSGTRPWVGQGPHLPAVGCGGTDGDREGGSGQESPGSVPDWGAAPEQLARPHMPAPAVSCRRSQASRPGGTVPDSPGTSSVTPTSFLGSPAGNMPQAASALCCWLSGPGSRVGVGLLGSVLRPPRAWGTPCLGDSG